MLAKSTEITAHDKEYVPEEKADLMRSPHQQYERTCTLEFKFSFLTML